MATDTERILSVVTNEEVVDALTRLLGQFDTKEAFAEELRSKHYTGKRSDVHGCPTTRYIRDALIAWRPIEQAAFSRLLVFALTVVIPIEGQPFSTGKVMKLPGPIHQFVMGFDDGEFPDLVSEPAVIPAPEPKKKPVEEVLDRLASRGLVDRVTVDSDKGTMKFRIVALDLFVTESLTRYIQHMTDEELLKGWARTAANDRMAQILDLAKEDTA